MLKTMRPLLRPPAQALPQPSAVRRDREQLPPEERAQLQPERLRALARHLAVPGTRFWTSSGRFVVTALTKEALPLVRCPTGDVTTFADGPCPCGRTHPRIARCSDRADGMLVVHGVNVSPSSIEAVLLQHAEVSGQYLMAVDRWATLAASRCTPSPVDGLLPTPGPNRAPLVQASHRVAAPASRHPLGLPGALSHYTMRGTKAVFRAHPEIENHARVLRRRRKNLYSLPALPKQFAKEVR